MWGLGRVIACEHPDLWGGLVDLDHMQSADDEAGWLIQDMLTSGVATQVAYRKAQRFVPRLVHHKGLKQPAEPWRCVEPATYMITGGLGALGLQLARWLVASGAKHLVLVGRRAGTAETYAVVRELEEAGVQVVMARADVAQEGQLTSVLREISERLPPLRGIIHAAGVLDDGVLLQQQWGRFTAVFASKVVGAWNVHTLTRDLSLDFMVFFSSAASLLGSPGQGNYAAANAFMDGLAHYRSALNLPSVSINWGPWAEVGAALGERRARYLAHGGMGSIPPPQGVAFLARVLGQSNCPQVALLPVNWRRFLRVFSGDRAATPLFAEFIRETSQSAQRQPGSLAPSDGESGRVARQLQESAPQEREALLRTYLRHQVATILNTDVALIPEDSELMRIGWDSLMVIQFAGMLQRELGVKLRPFEILKHPSINTIASYLSSTMSAVENVEPGSANVAQDANTTLALPGAEVADIPASSRNAWLPFYQPVAHRCLRLFCFPHAGGSAQVYRLWPAALPVGVQVCAVQPPGRWDRLSEQPFTRIADLVSAAVEGLLPYLVEPFAFFGHSMGAIVAFEMARELRRQHLPGPVQLYVSGRRAPKVPYTWSGPPLYELPDAELLEQLASLYQGVPEEVQQEQELLHLMLPALRADVEAYGTYVYVPAPPLACPIAVFGGLEDRTTTAENLEAWRDQTTASVTLAMFPGGHFFIHKASSFFLDTFGKQLQALLEQLPG
jgi:surfactin synthase thioesterase subunit/acyl carrier protein